MALNKMNDKSKVEKQYIDDTSLKIRKNLHNKYSENDQSFNSWLFNQYEFDNGYKILELGSGNGDIWEENIEQICEKTDLTLSDFSDGMVNILKAKYDDFNVKVEKIDIQKIPFEDSTFDIVVANAMLYHVPNLPKALSEVSRILKNGGLFYASTFGENGLNEYILNALEDLNLIQDKTINHSFTLQNGSSILSKYFRTTQKTEFVDGLRITETQDLVDYISTMTMIYDLETFNKDQLHEYFKSKKGEDEFIKVPKEYGTFISIK